MIKIIVLQQLYGNLSDEETEYSLLDRRSWQQFIELANARDLPYARTIWHFKNQLVETGGAEKIFAAVQGQLTRAGYQAQGGQMIDATIIPSPKMHFDREEKDSLKKDEQPQHWSDKQAAHKDTDAHWTMKHGKSYHGYKAHVNADQKHKLIRVLKVTPANKSEVNHLEPILDQSEGRNETGKTVFADRGYDSKTIVISSNRKDSETASCVKVTGSDTTKARTRNATNYLVKCVSVSSTFLVPGKKSSARKYVASDSSGQTHKSPCRRCCTTCDAG